MFKVTHYSGLISFLLLATSTSVYSVTDVQNKNKSIYAGSSDSRVNVKLTSKDDAAIEMLMKKSRDFKQINRKDQAAVIWERIIKSDPRHQQALAELASYRYQVGDYVTAQKLVDALAKVNSRHPAIGELNNLLREVRKGGYAAMSEEAYRNTVSRREKELMSKAADFDTQEQYANSAELYRKVQWLNPNNPWASLGLARALLKLGNKRAAEVEIEQVPFDAPEGHLAYALFYAEISAWEKVLSHINSMKESDKNASIETLTARALIHVDLNKSTKLVAEGKKEAAKKLLDGTEAVLDGNRQFDAEFSAVICAVWAKLDEYDRAIAFLDKRQPLNEAMQIYWLSLLVDSKKDERVVAELDRLEGDSSLHFTAAQKLELEKDRLIVGVRKIDQLIDDDKIAEAFVASDALLARFPSDPDLLVSKKRLDAATTIYAVNQTNQLLLLDRIEEAYELVISRLRLYPANDRLIAERKHIDAYKANRIEKGIAQSRLLVDNQKVLEAGQMIGQLYQRFPDDTSLFAENKRIQKLVAIEESGMGSAKEREVARLKSLEAVNKLNAQNIASAINENEVSEIQGYRGYVETGYSLLQKSGSAGLNKLTEREIPFAWHIPLKERSTELIFKAENISLNSGDVTPNINNFGFGGAVRHGTYVPNGEYPVSAVGNAVSVAYKRSGLSVDFGTSPAGFMLQNWVWGLRAEADYKSTSLSIEATRRSVMDTVISFAGAKEPFGGGIWGGVAKTGVQAAGYRRVADKLAIYASYGEFDFNGMNVANNHSRELNGSLIYDLNRSETSEMTLALGLSGSKYDNNQNSYTWGNGAYYSPQQVVSINLPFHFSGKRNRLSYSANASIGRSRALEDSPISYPTEPLWQANYGLQQTSATIFASVYNFDWNLEYKLTQTAFVGNTLRVSNNDSTYRQSSAMVYLRFDLDHISTRIKFPPAPIKTYFQTTQGGVAHN